MNTDRPVLITGAAGFIGFHLAARLLMQNPGLRIVGIDNMNDYYDVNLKETRLKELQKFNSFTFIKANIADKDKVTDIFRIYRPSIVVNLAAQAGVRYSITNPDSYIESNIVGFFNILEAVRHSRDCEGHHGVEHLIFASSSSVYGNSTKVPYSSDAPTDKPVSLYAATKKSNEIMAYAYAKLYNIPVTGLRFFTVYGPMGRPDMAYFDFTRKLIGRQKIRIFNYGECYRDFTYIDDVVEAMTRIIYHSPLQKFNKLKIAPPYTIYNIGNGKPEKLSVFIEIIQQELIHAGIYPADYNFSRHHELVPMQPGDVLITYSDTSTLARDFNFRPHTSLQTGLHRFIEWYIDYFGDRLHK